MGKKFTVIESPLRRSRTGAKAAKNKNEPRVVSQEKKRQDTREGVLILQKSTRWKKRGNKPLPALRRGKSFSRKYWRWGLKQLI